MTTIAKTQPDLPFCTPTPHTTAVASTAETAIHSRSPAATPKTSTNMTSPWITGHGQSLTHDSGSASAMTTAAPTPAAHARRGCRRTSSTGPAMVTARNGDNASAVPLGSV